MNRVTVDGADLTTATAHLRAVAPHARAVTVTPGWAQATFTATTRDATTTTTIPSSAGSGGPFTCPVSALSGHPGQNVTLHGDPAPPVTIPPPATTAATVDRALFTDLFTRASHGHLTPHNNGWLTIHSPTPGQVAMTGNDRYQGSWGTIPSDGQPVTGTLWIPPLAALLPHLTGDTLTLTTTRDGDGLCVSTGPVTLTSHVPTRPDQLLHVHNPTAYHGHTATLPRTTLPRGATGGTITLTATPTGQVRLGIAGEDDSRSGTVDGTATPRFWVGLPADRLQTIINALPGNMITFTCQTDANPVTGPIRITSDTAGSLAFTLAPDQIPDPHRVHVPPAATPSYMWPSRAAS